METCQCYYSPLVHQAKAVANSSSYASQRSSLNLSSSHRLIINPIPLRHGGLEILEDSFSLE